MYIDIECADLDNIYNRKNLLKYKYPFNSYDNELDDNILLVTSSGGGFVLPAAGDYYFGFTGIESGSTTKSQLQTIICTVGPGAITDYTVTPYTKDVDALTFYTINLNAPQALTQGNWQSVSSNLQTYFTISFETKDALNNNQFPLNLGLNSTANGGTFPCYGASALTGVSGGSLLTCTLSTAASASTSTPVIVTVTDFASIVGGNPLILYIPNIQNPASKTSGAKIIFSIYFLQNHLIKLAYQATITNIVMATNLVSKIY
jgi:hypothetical protein